MISIEEAKEAAGSKTRKARQKMSKIKLLIEIEKKTYELIKDKPDNIAESIIANGTPLPNEQIAWEQGYEAGLAQGKQDRPKGDILQKIPKDFVYDTETSEFYCYRNKYTGKEIHIVKNPPTYVLDKRPQGDLISREALKETIVEPLNVNDAGKNDWFEGYYTAKNEDVYYIDNAPPVPQVTVFTENADEKAIADLKSELQNVIKSRPKGEWTVTKLQHGEDVTCPFCNARPTKSEYGYYLRDNFCHECGADMRKGGAE